MRHRTPCRTPAASQHTSLRPSIESASLAVLEEVGGNAGSCGMPRGFSSWNQRRRPDVKLFQTYGGGEALPGLPVSPLMGSSEPPPEIGGDQQGGFSLEQLVDGLMDEDDLMELNLDIRAGQPVPQAPPMGDPWQPSPSLLHGALRSAEPAPAAIGIDPLQASA
eukprot:5802241-Prymnesium_polylepis.2